MKSYLWNMVAHIKNGLLINKTTIVQPKKKILVSFLNILWNEGYIFGYRILNDVIVITLKYIKGISAINSIKTVSKPGKKTYYTLKQLWKLETNQGLYIISTNKGLITLKQCKELKIGGMMLFFIT